MTRWRFSVHFFPVLAFALVTFASSGAGATGTEHAYAPGELIVGFVDSASPAAQTALHQRAGADWYRPLGAGLGLHMALVGFDVAADLSALENLYRNDRSVSFVHRNHVGGCAFTPNDTGWIYLWHHRNTGLSGGTPGADLDSRPAWNISRGSDQTVVAVLDTGIDSDHPEFVGRILPGYDFVNHDADPEDDHGHGSRASGLLAATADNAFGVAGVNHFCWIMPVKVLEANGGGLESRLIDGLGFAASNGADVINMSLGNFLGTPALLSALSAAQAMGSILVAAAGNGGIGGADFSFPGAASTTLSIGATDYNDQRASSSGTGNALDFVAPGSGVYTVKWNDNTDGMSTMNGTSAAAALASGVISVMLALDPTLTQSEVYAILQQTAEDQVGLPAEDTPGWDPYMGWGRLNLLFALQHVVAVNAPEIAAAPGAPFHVSATPNPAADHTAIHYSLPVNAWVKVTIHDVAGRRVRELLDGIGRAGANELEWDGRDASTDPVAPGVYFACVESSGRSEVTKIAVVR